MLNFASEQITQSQSIETTAPTPIEPGNRGFMSHRPKAIFQRKEINAGTPAYREEGVTKTENPTPVTPVVQRAAWAVGDEVQIKNHKNGTIIEILEDGGDVEPNSVYLVRLDNSEVTVRGDHIIGEWLLGGLTQAEQAMMNEATSILTDEVDRLAIRETAEQRKQVNKGGFKQSETKKKAPPSKFKDFLKGAKKKTTDDDFEIQISAPKTKPVSSVQVQKSVAPSSFAGKRIKDIPIHFFLSNPECLDFIKNKYGIDHDISTLGNPKEKGLVHGLDYYEVLSAVNNWIEMTPDLIPYRKITEKELSTEVFKNDDDKKAAIVSEIVHITLGVPTNTYFNDPHYDLSKDYDIEKHNTAYMNLNVELSKKLGYAPEDETEKVIPDEMYVQKTAAKSLAMGGGVCDDFAALTASLLRMVGVEQVNFIACEPAHNYATYGEEGKKLDTWYYAEALGKDWGDKFKSVGNVDCKAINREMIQKNILETVDMLRSLRNELTCKDERFKIDNSAFKARMRICDILANVIKEGKFPHNLSELIDFRDFLRTHATKIFKEEMGIV